MTDYSVLLSAPPFIAIVVIAVVAIVAAALFAWRAGRAQREAVRDRARLEGLEIIKSERDRAVADLEKERAAAKVQAAELAELKGAAHAREQALVNLRAEFENSFQALAAQALDANQQRFLAMANETFEKHKTAAQGGAKEVLAPVQEAFTKLSGSVDALEAARLQDKSAMGEHMRQIVDAMGATNTTTTKLINALRASPKLRGRWGEQTLRNVLEMSGLSSRIDFNEQTTTRDGDGAMLRPDVVINLPGGRHIVVDSKVALSGYLDAMEATDDMSREMHLSKHAQEMRAHVKKLSSKDY